MNKNISLLTKVMLILVVLFSIDLVWTSLTSDAATKYYWTPNDNSRQSSITWYPDNTIDDDIFDYHTRNTDSYGNLSDFHEVYEAYVGESFHCKTQPHRVTRCSGTGSCYETFVFGFPLMYCNIQNSTSEGYELTGYSRYKFKPSNLNSELSSFECLQLDFTTKVPGTYETWLSADVFFQSKVDHGKSGTWNLLTCPNCGSDGFIVSNLFSWFGFKNTGDLKINADYRLNYADSSGETINIPATTISTIADTKGDVEVTSSIPSREGYKFVGWSEEENSNIATYKPEDMVYMEWESGRYVDKTLYAVWTESNPLTLNSEVNLNAANGHGGVDLDWSDYLSEGKEFKAYQNKAGIEEWSLLETENPKSMTHTDETAQDFNAPNVPTAEYEGVKETNAVKLSYNSEDNGSEYSFKVEAVAENDTTNVLDTSNTRTETVTTGVNGYYYVIDDKPENYDFDTDEAEFTAENIANVDLSNNGSYFHVKAVDVAGNVSDPTTVQIMIKRNQTLNLDGGTLDGKEGPVEKEVMPGVPTDLGIPEKEGYTFTGWEDPDGPIEGNEYTYPLDDVPITATWTPNQYDYTIRYFEKGKTSQIAEPKTAKADFDSEILATDEAIKIDGFTYDSSNKESITITTNPENNTIDIYYIRVNGLSYTVNYLEKGTNEVVYPAKTQGDQTFGDIIKAEDEVIDVEGYNYDSSDKEQITITTGENVLNIYYTKKNDLSYTVKYLEKDTNTELATAKIVSNKEYKEEVTEEAINIAGYNKADPEQTTITIGVEGNEITFFYTKRSDLSYTVTYLEQDTNLEVAPSKTVGDKTLKETITEKAINVDGYNAVDTTEKSIVIEVNGNEITFYYTKRNDLSYTVKYLDEDTEEEIAESKTVGNQVFASRVTEQAIEVDGYNKVEPIEQTIAIDVKDNEIKFYYSKRSDLSYTVKYLEEKTNLEVAPAKTVGNKTLKETITEKAINVDGYNAVDPTEKSIVIEVSGNEVTFYYTKRADLSYTVKYVEKDTNTELADAKVVGNQVLGSTVVENAIVIDGYNSVEVAEKSIQIAVSGNEIIFYYTKRNDLNYTVNYLEKDTNIVLKDSKVVDGQTFGTVIETIEEKVAISGYDFDSIDKETLTITTNAENNVINIFYTKGKFNYTVEYYYDNELKETTAIEATFQDVITTYEDKNLPGYKLSEVEGLPLNVTEYQAMNVIKVYYVKDIFNYSVNYYYDETLAPEKTETFEAVFGTTIDTYTDKPEYGYEVKSVENLPLTISKDPAQNVINVFYGKKDSTVTVKYVDKETGKEIAPDGKDEGKVFDEIDIPGNKKDIDGYTLIETPPAGKHEDEEQEIIYYYAKNTRVIVKYLEKDTDSAVYPEIIIDGYEGKEYTTVEQKVDNYICVDNSGELNGKMTRNEITVIYYYSQNTKVVVNHIDQISGGILATESQEGLVGDKYSSSAKNFDGYVLVEKPEEETVTMAKDVITLNYYYKKVSAGVIEKHIDIKSGELLDSKLHEGNEGDKYTTKEKSFYGYDIVADQMPENAEGVMTVEVIEVKYYYIRKASVKVEYIDKATGKTINETYQLEEKDSTEYIRGYEGDPYKTVEKQFTGYDIVPELRPANAEGVMQVVKDENGNIVLDSNGNAVTETVVRYYYAYQTQVVEKYVDAKTGEVIEEISHPGHEGDEYEIKPKEIPGYDLVEDKKPTNSKGTMTSDIITVEYQYVRKMTVRVEYLDVMTNKVLTEKVQVPGRPGIYTEKDSTENIEGYEGDSYTTKEKSFENYTIVKNNYPQNWQGTMEGTELVVRYYYVHVSSGVVEKHIDAITGKELESETRYNGNEGDSYKTSSKEFKGYDVVTTRLPQNSEGKMARNEIVVKYYYIRKSNVTVQYLEENTTNKLEPDKIIEGHEGDKYYTEKKNIVGYEFVRNYGEKDGTLGKDDITVKYYYKKVQAPAQNNNQTPTTTQQKVIKTLKDLPDTGDIVPFVAGGVILLVTMANIMISVVKKRRNKN